MQVHRVVHLDALHESRPYRVVIDDQAILLTKVDGEPLAIADDCPHRGDSLSQGAIEHGCVICARHKARYRLRGGQPQDTSDIPVQVYATRLTADGWVEVEVP